MEMLKLYSLEDLKGCPLDKWGILDPGTSRYDVSGETRENGKLCFKDERPLRTLMVVMDTQAQPLDLILLPGVAFDGECNRVCRFSLPTHLKLMYSLAEEKRTTIVSCINTPQPIHARY